MNDRRRTGLCVVLAATTVLAGCGGGGGTSSSDSAAASSVLARLSSAAAGLTATTRSQPHGVPTGKIRVINLYSSDGRPGGPIDLFDVFHPTASDVPIIKNLAYGQASDYVSPRAAAGNPSQLWLFPAGSLQPSGAYTGSNISNAGWTADQQVTVVLMPGSASGSVGSKDLNDAPSADATATPPAGEATVLTWNADFNLSAVPNAYLAVDGRCPAALDQSPGEPGMLGGTFAVPAGPHTLGVIGSVAGSGMTAQQCGAKAAAAPAAASLTAAGGGRVDVVGYQDGGTWKLLVAPVQ